MNVPSYEALLDKETRIKVIRELCENVNKALNSQMSVAEATGTSVEAEVGKYYRYADPVASLVVTLPQVLGTSQPSNISFFLTTGNDPDIKFESDADVYLSGESTFSDDTSYYITATYDGVEWVVNVSVATFQSHDYSQDYLTFDILTGGTIIWKKNVNSTPSKTIQYSTDNGSTWTSITSTRSGVTINVETGDKLLFKGLNNNYGEFSDEAYYNFFGGTAQFNLSGNILSLIYGDDFMEYDELPQQEYATYTAFGELFNHTNVVDASELILPTTIQEHCYGSMFFGCTSLTTAPKLTATTLAQGCYESMFSDCTSLETAPELPATTLVGNCYYGMFSGCTSLNYIKCLATDISASYCVVIWLRDVAATGTFVKAVSMSSWTTGDSGIPNGWAVETAST